MELMQAVEHYATAMKLADRYGNDHGDMDTANNAWHECRKAADRLTEATALMRQMQEALITARKELWNAGCNASSSKVLSAIAAFDEFNGKPETANALRKMSEGLR